MTDHVVTVVETVATPTQVVPAATTWDEFPHLWGELLGEVWGVLRTSEGALPGRNVMLYRDDVPHVEVGAEIGGSFAGSGRVVASTLPAGSSATAISRGAPSAEGIAAAHAAVVDWCAGNGRELTGVRWEVHEHWRDDQGPDAYEIAVHRLLR